MYMSDKGTIDEASCIAWACREFGKAPLKDARRTARLVAIAAGLAHDVGHCDFKFLRTRRRSACQQTF